MCMNVWRSVLSIDATSIEIFPHYFIFDFKKFWRKGDLIARRISLSKTTLSPRRELGFEDFLAFDIAPFATASFTGVGFPWIFFFFYLKRFCREFLLRFGRPLLLISGAIGAAVTGGANASTGAISCGLMFDVWEGKNEAGSWFFLDGSHCTIPIKIDLSSERDQCADDELHEK